jgi:hypothetical protein
MTQGPFLGELQCFNLYITISLWSTSEYIYKNLHQANIYNINSNIYLGPINIVSWQNVNQLDWRFHTVLFQHNSSEKAGKLSQVRVENCLSYGR